jgi:flagellar secretion chaperone FliS
VYPQPKNAYQVYRQNQVNSADPVQLVIMAYDAALVACREHNLPRVAEVLDALMDSLDHEAGGQVAANLLGLYQYSAELVRTGHYDDAAYYLRELRDAWVQLRKQVLQEASAAQVQQAAQVAA